MPAIRTGTGRRILIGRVGGRYTAPPSAASTPTWRASSTATSTTGAFSVSAPAGTASGDVLVLVVYAQRDTKYGVFGSLSSAGWTARLSQEDGGALTFGYNLAIYTKVAGASETSYTWGGASAWVGGVMAVAAVSSASAFDVVGTLSSTGTASAVSPTGSSDLLLYIAVADVSTTPTGMTTRVNVTTPVVVNIDSQSLTASGSTGSRTGSGLGASVLLAVK